MTFLQRPLNCDHSSRFPANLVVLKKVLLVIFNDKQANYYFFHVCHIPKLGR
ncbi:hypothetical protein FIS3754_35640 [Fischerella sp. NIES-3754]|nr:hypothetical protein FIS3754_35640 [Fischerella sp. NIES-3754]BCX09971.1 MAG: hypothetical protein KatS3mg066_3830 [Fischerella sp.]